LVPLPREATGAYRSSMLGFSAREDFTAGIGELAQNLRQAA
jgi:hypothetical protein